MIESRRPEKRPTIVIIAQKMRLSSGASEFASFVDTDVPIQYTKMPKRREPSPSPSASDSDSDISSRQDFSDDDEAVNAAAQWIDEDELDGMVDSEEDEFAQEGDSDDDGGSEDEVVSLPFF